MKSWLYCDRQIESHLPTPIYCYDQPCISSISAYLSSVGTRSRMGLWDLSLQALIAAQTYLDLV